MSASPSGVIGNIGSIGSEIEPGHAGCARRRSAMETPPCSWTKPPCHRRGHRRHPTNDHESRYENAEAIPTPPSQAATETDITVPELPEVVIQHIHSLMTMRDAARAACVSRSFLGFWRHYPTLAFNQETLAASRQPLLQSKDRGKYVFTQAWKVLKKHSGAGVRTLKLNLSTCCKDDIDAGLLDGWLRACFAAKPVVADLALQLPNCYHSDEYSFPYSLLLTNDAADTDDNGSSSTTASSIQFLHLVSCGFHPTVVADGPGRPLACSWSLSKLRLCRVSVTGDELWLFLSSCFSLEQLDLSDCDMVASLKIPRVLRRLKVVCVRACRGMTVVESEALNLSKFSYEGWPLSRFTLGDSLETKELDVITTRMPSLLQYAGSNLLPSIAPNLERLVLSTYHEIADDFAWYKKYHIVGQPDENPWQFSRQEIPGIRYGGLGNLSKATITGFCTAKSLVELTWHILDRASSSLQCLVLDTTPGYNMKGSSSDRCLPMRTEALVGVRKYVEPKVPIGAELKVLGPCTRCHAMDAEGVAEEASSETPRRFLQRQEDGRIALVYVLPRS